MPNRLSSERDRLSAMASCSCSGISSFGQSIIRPRGMKGEEKREGGARTRRRRKGRANEEGRRTGGARRRRKDGEVEEEEKEEEDDLAYGPVSRCHVTRHNRV